MLEGQESVGAFSGNGSTSRYYFLALLKPSWHSIFILLALLALQWDCPTDPLHPTYLPWQVPLQNDSYSTTPGEQPQSGLMSPQSDNHPATPGSLAQTSAPPKWFLHQGRGASPTYQHSHISCGPITRGCTQPTQGTHLGHLVLVTRGGYTTGLCRTPCTQGHYVDQEKPGSVAELPNI